MNKISFEHVLMDVLMTGRGTDRVDHTLRDAELCGSSDQVFDFSTVQRVIAELGSDWAFAVRLHSDGTRDVQWFDGGRSSDRFDLRNSTVPDGSLSAVAEHFTQALHSGSSRSQFLVESSNGDSLWIESSLSCVGEADSHDPLFVYGAIRDIADKRRLENALRKSESQYEVLVEQALEGILISGESGRIEASNSAARDLSGLSEQELRETMISDLFHRDEINSDSELISMLTAGRTVHSVRRMKQAGTDQSIWTELSANQVDDGRVLVTVRDISERMETEQRIQDLAYFDSLTGLPNRELFREKFEEALERCRRCDKRLALLFLDIDRFKQVNDSLGHSSGDELLKQVSGRIKAVLRGSDPVSRSSGLSVECEDEVRDVSRLGGDEFTVLIEDLDHSQDAARVARRVLHSLSQSYDVSDQEVFIGCSIGIAVWPDDGRTSELLLRSADTAMFHAKGRGGDSYAFFNASMNIVSARRLSVETRLRRALERDEFKLVYQPIRDAKTGRMSAAEALLRWVDSAGEIIGPDEFIPIAEEIGLIVEIGAWVLRTACLQARDWKAAGHVSFRMSVNIAVAQLRDPGIVQGIDQILFESGLSPAELELEITESSILDDDPNIMTAISQLTDMGIGFALDDFGTGYSSLSALQRFPIERLKIDRSFVSGVDTNKNDQALTSAIVALAKRLDQKVVAEGVETEGQARFLQNLGCDELQGYLFSRPLPPEDFVAVLEFESKVEED